MKQAVGGGYTHVDVPVTLPYTRDVSHGFDSRTHWETGYSSLYLVRQFALPNRQSDGVNPVSLYLTSILDHILQVPLRNRQSNWMDPLSLHLLLIYVHHVALRNRQPNGMDPLSLHLTLDVHQVALRNGHPNRMNPFSLHLSPFLQVTLSQRQSPGTFPLNLRFTSIPIHSRTPFPLLLHKPLIRAPHIAIYNLRICVAETLCILLALLSTYARVVVLSSALIDVVLDGTAAVPVDVIVKADAAGTEGGTRVVEVGVRGAEAGVGVIAGAGGDTGFVRVDAGDSLGIVAGRVGVGVGASGGGCDSGDSGGQEDRDGGNKEHFEVGMMV
jgi:hypothetical protein